MKTTAQLTKEIKEMELNMMEEHVNYVHNILVQELTVKKTTRGYNQTQAMLNNEFNKRNSAKAYKAADATERKRIAFVLLNKMVSACTDQYRVNADELEIDFAKATFGTLVKAIYAWTLKNF